MSFAKRRILIAAVAVCSVIGLFISTTAQAQDPLDKFNIVWDNPSKSANDSMPTGNGQIGLNVWVEANGDLLFCIGRTDSFGYNGRLLKLGRVGVNG